MHAFANLLHRMALHGEWQPVFDFLKDAIAAQTSIRDYLDGEKVIQGFLAAYLSVSRHFLVRTEPELNKGFADIALEPLVAQYPELRHGYLIRLRHLRHAKAAMGTLGTLATPLDAAARSEEALGSPQDDWSGQRAPLTPLTILVTFHGWKMVCCEAT